MENIFYKGDFYPNLDSLINKVIDFNQEIEDLPDDWVIDCIGSK